MKKSTLFWLHEASTRVKGTNGHYACRLPFCLTVKSFGGCHASSHFPLFWTNGLKEQSFYLVGVSNISLYLHPSLGLKAESQQQPVTVRKSWNCSNFIRRRPYNSGQEHFSARTYFWMYRKPSKSAVCTWCRCWSALYTESKGARSDYQTS